MPKPNKLLGQHFLKTSSVIPKIIDALDLATGDTIIEVGAGHGELTLPLFEKCLASGYKIIAVEKDPILAEELAEELGDKAGEEIKFVTGDILKILPDLVAGMKGKKYKIAGNIPYYLTGHLLRGVSELNERPERCVFMVQKEVAERMAAEPPSMNRLAASIQLWADIKIIVAVPRTSFIPPPKVDSCVILLTAKQPKITVNEDSYYRAIRLLFAQPRKTILNNVAAGMKDHKDATKEKISATLQSLGIDPLLRPQNLSVENIISIANVLSLWRLRQMWG